MTNSWWMPTPFSSSAEALSVALPSSSAFFISSSVLALRCMLELNSSQPWRTEIDQNAWCSLTIPWRLKLRTSRCWESLEPSWDTHLRDGFHHGQKMVDLIYSESPFGTPSEGGRTGSWCFSAACLKNSTRPELLQLTSGSQEHGRFHWP